MATELDHTFTTTKPIDESYRGGDRPRAGNPLCRGRERDEVTGPDSVKAEILLTMGAMSMTFVGTVELAEKDADAHRAVLRIKAKDSEGQGHANADVVFQLNDSGGEIHTKAQITGKAASMGEGVVIGVLDGLITDFTGKLGEM